MTKEELFAKICAINMVNKMVVSYAPGIFDTAKKFLNRKIQKVDGSYTKEFLEHLVLPNTTKNTIAYISNSYRGSLSINFKAHVNCDITGGNFVHYEETTLYVGDVNNAILSNIYRFEPEEYKHDYDYDYVISSVKKLRVAKRALNKAAEECGPFSDDQLYFITD